VRTSSLSLSSKQGKFPALILAVRVCGAVVWAAVGLVTVTGVLDKASLKARVISLAEAILAWVRHNLCSSSLDPIIKTDQRAAQSGVQLRCNSTLELG